MRARSRTASKLISVSQQQVTPLTWIFFSVLTQLSPSSYGHGGNVEFTVKRGVRTRRFTLGSALIDISYARASERYG